MISIHAVRARRLANSLNTIPIFPLKHGESRLIFYFRQLRVVLAVSDAPPTPLEFGCHAVFEQIFRDINSNGYRVHNRAYIALRP